MTVVVYSVRGEWERIAELEAKNARLRDALAPFAKIVPSTFFPGDGSEGDKYEATLVDGREAQFTGLDLRRAREAIE